MHDGLEGGQVNPAISAAIRTYMRILEDRLSISESSRSVANIWSGQGGIDAEMLSGALFHRYFSIAAQVLVERNVLPSQQLGAYQDIERTTRTAISALLDGAAAIPDCPRAASIATVWRDTTSARLAESLILVLQNWDGR